MQPTALYMRSLCAAWSSRLEFIWRYPLHERERWKFVVANMGLAFSMNATARSDELYVASTSRNPSQKLSLGPLASDIFPKEEQTAVAPFLRPDPEVLSEAIPVFFIGRNRDGYWVARDAEGRFGGLFWRKEGALRFARRSAGPVGCATVFPRGHVELDIENAGNPFVPWMAAIRHLLIHATSTIMTSLRKVARP